MGYHPFAELSASNRIIMAGDAITRFESMLAAGRDNALLRFSLGNEYLKSGNAAAAVSHLEQAVVHDPGYSAAWKLLGRALTENGDFARALVAYERGIAVAKARGDKQAAKEMSVFARRIVKRQNPAA